MKNEVISVMECAADWQIAHPNDEIGLRLWHMAPYYDGLIAMSEATGNAKYLAEVMARGEQVGWTLADRMYHADDHAVGHAWLDVYAMDKTHPERLEYVQKRMDAVIENPIKETLRFGVDPYPAVTNRWSWCDALYMAPPTLARLYAVTGDIKYRDFMDHEYRYTYDELWDSAVSLFYRDSRFLGQLTEAGKKVFWSRGNGWVYGGLPMILDALPANDTSRSFYETLFLKMSDSIRAAQQDDGLWRPNLADPEQVKTGESSGSGFFLYGIAWGLNHGLLDRETFIPVLVKGWQGLMTRIQPEGFMGYVQPVGFDPRNNIEPQSTHVYGVGALMLAGSELLRLLGENSSKDLNKLYQEAEAILESRSWIPETGGYVVPQRVDDIAWENDRIAFRVYGPSLKDSVEDSGVDVWCKRTTNPIVYKWYSGSFDGTVNYHEDTGEGFDGYKVGSNRGCGGSALWYEGKLYTANVYQIGTVYFTEPERVKLGFEYRYDVEGKIIVESKVIELRGGEYLCNVSSAFKGDPDILQTARFVVGLTPQNKGTVATKLGNGLVMWEPVGAFDLGTVVRIDVEDALDPEPLAIENCPDSLLSVSFGPKAVIHYQLGCAWAGNSPFQTESDWMNFLKNR